MEKPPEKTRRSLLLRYPEPRRPAGGDIPGTSTLSVRVRVKPVYFTLFLDITRNKQIP
jgi:hypothetical protein